jgi:alkylation response protein AidB-like acyl-CoA dehydrogenase
MTLVLTEEQELLRDAARDFLARRSPVARFRELRDSGDRTGFDRTLWSEMAELGWPAINVPEAMGGLGYGSSGLGIVLEECGRTLASSPLISTALMGVTALLESGNRALCEAWLPGIAAGEKLLAVACEEGRRHAPRHVALGAAPAGDGFVLTGAKNMVPDGHVADALLVSARTTGETGERDGISLFLVERGGAGMRETHQALLDNHGAARVRFEGVQIGADRMLGAAGRGWPILAKALDAGRIGAAAELLGIAREVFERTLGYLRERRQFGVPIGSFQALQHRAAILFGEIELCQSVVLRALQALDGGEERLALFASLAKARAGETARLATAEAIQMHGGIGMTDQFDLGFFIKRYKALDQLLGDANYHLERFARLRGY